jgi:dihydroxyacetone kinase
VPHGPITDSRITTEGTGLDSTTTAAVEKNQNNGSQKEDKEENEEEEEVAVAVIRKCVEAACQALISSEAELNELDAKVGDGDCGSTLATGARAVLDALPSFQLNSAAATALSLANAIGLHVGGTSGGVFKIFFTSAAAALRTSKEETGNTSSGKNLTIESAAMALKAGVEAVMKYGGAERGYRTLVDALAPASDALSRFDAASSGEGAAAAAAAEAMAAAAEKGAEETKSMHALAGRSSYVPDAVLQGVPDPGAVGVARWMRAIAETLKQE